MPQYEYIKKYLATLDEPVREITTTSPFIRKYAVPKSQHTLIYLNKQYINYFNSSLNRLHKKREITN